MNWNEVVEEASRLDEQQRMRWLHSLGSLMTVAARAGYGAAQQGEGSIPHLIAFNELQHTLYNFILRSPDWPLERFLEALRHVAVSSHVENDFGWALKRSIEFTRADGGQR